MAPPAVAVKAAVDELRLIIGAGLAELTTRVTATVRGLFTTPTADEDTEMLAEYEPAGSAPGTTARVMVDGAVAGLILAFSQPVGCPWA